MHQLHKISCGYLSKQHLSILPIVGQYQVLDVAINCPDRQAHTLMGHYLTTGRNCALIAKIFPSLPEIRGHFKFTFTCNG